MNKYKKYKQRFTRGVAIDEDLHRRVVKELIKPKKFKSFSSFVTSLIKGYFNGHR